MRPKTKRIFPPQTVPTSAVRTALLLIAVSAPAFAQAPAPSAPLPPRQAPAPLPAPSLESPISPPAGQIVSPLTPGVAIPTESLPAVPVSEDERRAIEISSLDLNLHLIPADAREEVRATVTVRNAGASAATRLPLRISSTLRWLAISVAGPAGLRPLPFTQSPVADDSDHTGYAEEAVLTPAEPLAPGATLTLSLFYAGEIRPSAARLQVLGAPSDQAARTEWDQIAPTSDAASTALRGFGNVLWYPIAAATAVLGDGNRLFESIARERQRNAAVSMRLRLTVDYLGDPPDSAIFNGNLQPLARSADLDSQLISESHGTATAEFPAATIGRRIPSLFLTAQHGVTTPDQALTLVSPRPEAMQPEIQAASALQPLLSAWLGPGPLQPLIVLDHAGEAFEDGAFLALDAGEAGGPAIAGQIVRPLTHAWMRLPSTAWLDEGIPEFMSLLWLEQSQGREAAIARLQHASVLLALAEPLHGPPSPSTGPVATSPGQPLTSARSDVLLRFKSAAVLWQLRELLGEEPMRAALTAFRRSLKLNPRLAADPAAFQRSLEASTRTDLGWFFADWVYRDPGLPDLSIVQATPRPLPARPGKSAGYLVAVEVKNDGDAVADVPVTVRSGSLSSSQRLRIAAHATGSTRVLFEGLPDTLQVNDGSVPELGSTIHSLSFAPPAAP